MSTTLELANAASSYVLAAPASGGGGGWDIVEFLTNGQDYGQKVGGALLGLAGLVAIVWGGVLGVKKLMSEQSRDSWFRAGGLIFVGGLLFFGGLNMLMNISSGAKDTVNNFGDTGAMGSSYSAPVIPGS